MAELNDRNERLHRQLLTLIFQCADGAEQGFLSWKFGAMSRADMADTTMVDPNDPAALWRYLVHPTVVERIGGGPDDGRRLPTSVRYDLSQLVHWLIPAASRPHIFFDASAEMAPVGGPVAYVTGWYHGRLVSVLFCAAPPAELGPELGKRPDGTVEPIGEDPIAPEVP